MDKSNTDLSLLRKQFEVFNKSEGKAPRTVEWYSEVIRLLHEWLVSEERPTTLGEVPSR